MSARTSSSFGFLTVCFLVCSSNAQTNMEAENITAVLGQDVILPCKVPNNTNIRAVMWIRPDQEPQRILFYINGRLVPENQHPSYKNWVDLKDKEMKDGDASLSLKNVMKNDTGRYECLVFEKGKNESISIINLEVHLPGDQDGGDKTGIIVAPVVGVILLLLVLGSVGFLIYRRYKRQNPNLPVPPDDPAAIEMLQQFPDQHQQQPQLV